MLGIAVKKQDVIKNLQAENQRLQEELFKQKGARADAEGRATHSAALAHELEIQVAELQHEYRERPHIATYNRMRSDHQKSLADVKAARTVSEMWRKRAQYSESRLKWLGWGLVVVLAAQTLWATYGAT